MKGVDFFFNLLEAMLLLWVIRDYLGDFRRSAAAWGSWVLFLLMYVGCASLIRERYVIDLLLLMLISFGWLFFSLNLPKKGSLMVAMIFVVFMELSKQMALVPLIRLGLLDWLQIFGLARKWVVSFCVVGIQILVSAILKRSLKGTELERIHAGNILLLLLPLCSVICIRMIFLPTYSPEFREWPYVNAVMMLLLEISVVLTALAVLWHNFSLQKQYELNQVQRTMESQFEHIERKTQQDQAVMRMYHDIKNQLNCIRGYDNRENMSHHIEELEKQISEYEIVPHTQNPVLNTLLHDKAMLAKEKGMELRILMDFSQGDFISGADLCSIFGNALDNAIEAASKVEDPQKKYITVKAATMGEYLVIRLENYYAEKPVRQGNTFLTTKENQMLHGFGLQSIRLSTEKYGGRVLTDLEEDRFCLKIVIPIPAE